MAETDLRTYRGNCHCGAFVYEVRVPEIKKVSECVCSLCSKKGYLWVPVKRADFSIVKGDDSTLTSYTWGTKQVAHKFCPHCATPTMAVNVGDVPGREIVVNAHSIQGLNTWTLERTSVDGSVYQTQYVAPPHKGDHPSAQIEGGKVYTGSCHCGNITVAVMSAPLDKTYAGALECNCSICERNGYIWLYPKVEHIVISSDPENMGKYVFGSGMLSKTFCKTCGVPMTNDTNEMSPEAVAALPETGREFYARQKLIRAVNARVLSGLDLSQIPVQRFDGATIIPQPYHNP